MYCVVIAAFESPSLGGIEIQVYLVLHSQCCPRAWQLVANYAALQSVGRIRLIARIHSAVRGMY